MATEKEPSPLSFENMIPSLSSPVAIFPQYVTKEPTVITISECDAPNPRNDFTVHLADGQHLFSANREHGIFTFRQYLIDARTNTKIFTIRRTAKILLSFQFEDESGKEILDLSGKVHVSVTGSRATASFTNSSDQRHVELNMHGSWHNYQATIKNKATDEVIAKMQSEILTLRAYTGRRDYKVAVSAGVDLAIITGMIVCLDVSS